MSEVLKHCDEVLSIIMRREEDIPAVPQFLSKHDKLLFEMHFTNRKIIEHKNYGDLHFEEVFGIMSPMTTMTHYSANLDRARSGTPGFTRTREQDRQHRYSFQLRGKLSDPKMNVWILRTNANSN